jgi:ATP-binding protein involved in chromosome partitioning
MGLSVEETASAPDANGVVTEARVLDALREIIDPDLHRDIVSLGMIKDLAISPAGEGSHVAFTFELTTPACPVRDQFKTAATAAVEAIPGIHSVDVHMSANVRAAAPTTKNHDINLPNVRNVIAVASGKGGVGKSTVAANIAVALAESGASVGLLDADVYGPSVPQLMGVRDGIRAEEGKMVPNQAYGVKLISLGFIAGDKPIMWRGPMIGHALKQLLEDVNWGDLDYLVIDLPPGTGDAQISLAQLLPMSGVVIVSTPQDLALGIAQKALLMFRQLHVPILGIVENMSTYCCPNCGHEVDIFGSGGPENAAKEMQVPFLGRIPLDLEVRKGSDVGIPVPVSNPESASAVAFASVARKTAAQVSIRNQRTIPLAIL